MAEQLRKGLTILRRKQLREKTGLSYATIYQWMSEDRFPKPINLGGTRAVGWIEAEIEQWLEDRIAASRKTA